MNRRKSTCIIVSFALYVRGLQKEYGLAVSVQNNNPNAEGSDDGGNSNAQSSGGSNQTSQNDSLANTGTNILIFVFAGTILLVISGITARRNT